MISQMDIVMLAEWCNCRTDFTQVFMLGGMCLDRPAHDHIPLNSFLS